MSIISSSKSENPARVSLATILRVLMAVEAFWFIASALYVTLSRFSYPFDLEWMEGGSLVEVLRLLAGKQLYVSPTLEYVPYIYPPLYFYLSALLAKLTNQAWFPPLRLVSMLASAGIAVLIYRIILRQTDSKYWALIGSGFFVATFQIGGGWFDIARVDMLFVFFLVAAVFLLERSTLQSGIIAGLLFTCAFFTKQTSLIIFFVMIAFFFIFRNRKIAFITAISFLLSSGIWFAVENARSLGWYRYYVFTLPGLHALPPFDLIIYLGPPLKMILPVCIALIIEFVRFLLAPVDVLNHKSSIWVAYTLGALATSIVGSINPGGYINTYIPFYSASAILLGINLPWLIGQFRPPHQEFKRLLIYTLCISQFIVLYYNPVTQIPTSEDLKAGQQVVAILKQIDGDVLIPSHNYLTLMANKPAFANLVALEEIHGDFGTVKDQLWNSIKIEIDAALRTRKFQTIILDQSNLIFRIPLSSYARDEILYSSADVFWPIAGAHTRPRYIYTRIGN